MTITQEHIEQCPVLNARRPFEEPYHFQLEKAVKNMTNAHVTGYPVSYEWVERLRDDLSRILDKMDGKNEL